MCVAGNIVSCAVDFPHSFPGFSLLPWEGFGSCGAPAQRAAVLQPCPSAQPNGSDVPSPEKLALTSALPFSCCFFSHKHILQELLRGECCSLFAASEEAACKRKAAFIVCVVPLVSSLNLVLWAEVSIYEPDVTWKVMTAAVGYS